MSSTRYRVSIETSLTEFTPRPNGVMETLLLEVRMQGTNEYTQPEI